MVDSFDAGCVYAVSPGDQAIMPNMITVRSMGALCTGLPAPTLAHSPCRHDANGRYDYLPAGKLTGSRRRERGDI